MCGVALGLAEGFRRSASGSSLRDLPAGAAPLKSIKSLSDLQAAVDLAAELSGLCKLERSNSQQCSSEDTARGSPTSGYEQLLRSRSPCAVLFAAEAADAPAAPVQPPHLSPDDVAGPRLPSRGLPPLHPLAAAGSGHSSLAEEAAGPQLPLGVDDTPFLESAASYSVVEVQSAAARSSAFFQPAPGAPPRGQAPGSSSAMAAATAAAASASQSAFAAAASQDAFTAAAASQGAFAAATAMPAPRRANSGSPPASSSSGASTSGLTAAVAAASGAPTPSPFARLSSLSLQDHPSVISGGGGGGGALGASTADSSAASSPTASGSQRSLSELARRGSLDGWGTSPHLSEGHAAEELFYRLNHARQTVDFVKRQATAFGQLSRGPLGVWEALELLNTLREYETALLGDPHDGDPGAPAAPDMPLLEHALQCAEACRAAFPDEEWMHLAGLLAPLGKLLAHAKWGAEPQWAICGETFPVGCRFHPAVRHSQYFSANPDRRKRLYSSPTGVYREGCGLGGVLMSWGGGEYLHLVLRLNRVPLPPEALFCLRHQKLRCVFRPGAPYHELLSEFDRVQLPRLAKFQALCAYRRAPRAQPLLVPAPDAPLGGGPAAAAGGADGGVGGEGGEVPLVVSPPIKAHYDRLIAKYIPGGVLRW